MSSPLDDAIRNAVADALAGQLGDVVEQAVRRALADLQIGDAGDQLLDASVTAPLLGSPSASALRRAAERGTAPVEPIRVGRRLKWRRRDVMAYVTAQRDKAAGR